VSPKRRAARNPQKPAPPAEPLAAPPPPFVHRVAIVAALLLTFFALVLGNIFSTSETIDESTHLAAGYTYLTAHDYRLNPEHPPLLKLVAALPLLGRVWPGDFRTPEVEDVHKGGTAIRLLQQEWALSLLDQVPHYAFGHYLFYPYSQEALSRLGAGDPHDIRGTADVRGSDLLNDAESLFHRARTAAALFGLLLGGLVFAWAYELFGWRGGVFALVLFAFEPNFIAHSGLVTTDVAVSAFFLATIYFLWRACRELTIGNALGFALAFALALTSKFSALLLLPTIGVLLLRQVLQGAEWRWRFSPEGRVRAVLATRPRKLLAAFLLATTAAVAAFAVIWTLYGFRYDSVADPGREAVGESVALSQTTRVDLLMRASSLPLDGHPPLLERVKQTAAFDSLRGQYRDLPPLGALRATEKSVPIDFIGNAILFAAKHRLLPEAYLYGFAYLRTSSFYRPAYLNGAYSSQGFPDYFFWTTLLKTPIPTLVALLIGIVAVLRRRGDRAFLLVPPLIYIGVAVGSAIDIGHRHLLPALAFLIVGCGAMVPKRRLLPVCGLVAVAGLFVFAPPWNPAPLFGHHLAYFNELAGGPRNGYEHLVDSNLDWGQDLPALRRWLDANHVTEPIALVYFGDADPRTRGIHHRNLGMFAYEPQDSLPIGAKYVAISANSYVGVLDPVTRNAWRERLKGAKLAGRAGYSILIYRLDG
jgi:4-amino-4-deoxy-L-arabinose transferase-like glycosyltransferase